MQDKNTKYDSMAITHFKLPIKKKKKDLKRWKWDTPNEWTNICFFFFLTLDSDIYIYIYISFDKLDPNIVAKY